MTKIVPFCEHTNTPELQLNHVDTLNCIRSICGYAESQHGTYDEQTSDVTPDSICALSDDANVACRYPCTVDLYFDKRTSYPMCTGATTRAQVGQVLRPTFYE